MSASQPLLIGEVFRRNAAVAPAAVAASLGCGRLTHAELDRTGNRLARALAAQGVARGDRVVCWAETSLEVLPVFAALAKLGAVFAPLSARLGEHEAGGVLGMARPALLLADAEHGEIARSLAKQIGCRVLELGRLGEREPGTLYDLAASAATSQPPLASELRETDPHVIFFTSGSTGRPKGVVISHRASWLRSFQGVFRDEPERTVCMFPLFHMAAFTLALAAWQTRGEIALVAAASAEEILTAAQRRRANRLYCIPAVWHRILESDTRRFDLSSLRELDTGTSATPIELIRAVKERFPGTRTRIYYGSTEVGSATTLGDADVLRKPGSVGPPSPGVDLRLTPEGEICVRSAYLMDGYFEDAAATAAALRDGWFHTGDTGALDEEGHLSIQGRLKELIRSGGESIAPAEVEAALRDHPAVAEIAVIGLPDPQWGEIVCAVVVEKPGASLDLESLQKHCAERLAGFKKPRRLERVAALPRTPATGQVQRALLAVQIGARPAGRP
jgi:acyl-CoA synthetase (AMP-forming)/AMP-acid ligase II